MIVVRQAAAALERHVPALPHVAGVRGAKVQRAVQLRGSRWVGVAGRAGAMVRRAVQRAVQLHTQQRLPPKACRQQACAWPHRAYAVGRLRYVRRGPAMPPCPCKCLTVRMSFAASIMSSSPLAAQWPYLPQPMQEELAHAPTCGVGWYA